MNDLEVKQLGDGKRIENLSTELTASQEENGALKRELTVLQHSFELSQKKTKAGTLVPTSAGVSNKSSTARRWYLLFFGVK